MPGSSNTSFIPKRNSTHNNRQNVKQQVFLGSFIIRIIFFASLIAAAGVFAYETKLNNNLQDEIANLDNAIKSFSEADMERVVKMDSRLSQANYRLKYSASIVSLLTAIEKSTTGSNQITELTLTRSDDKLFEIEAAMKTGTFDSVLFQREVLENSETLVISEIEDLTLNNVPPEGELYAVENLEAKDDKVSVSFKALMSVDTEKIPHTAVPIEFSNIQLEESTEPAVSTQNEETNQEGL